MKVWSHGRALALSAMSCALLSGCTRVQEAFMTVPDKVNAAYPPAPELIAAEQRLLQMVESDSASSKTVRTQLAARKDARALACSQKVSIGRLDTVESVRARGLERVCFQAQDQTLEQFIGLRMAGLLLAKPPLRPLVPVGESSVLPAGKLTYIIEASFAAKAGVAVVRGQMGDGAVVEVPSGAVLATLPSAQSHPNPTQISPNGRLVAARLDHMTMSLFDAESGVRLLTLPKTYGPLAWLPSVEAVLLSTNNGPVMADLQAGTLEPYTASANDASYAATWPGEGARVMVGNARELVLADHSRGANGVVARVVKSYSLSPHRGISSGHPTPMRGGKLALFVSHPDIGWLDTETGAVGTWRMGSYYNPTSAKLDETHLLVDSRGASATATQAWVYDIAAQTVAPMTAPPQEGRLGSLGERGGYMRLGSTARLFDSWKAGSPEPVDAPVARFQLEQQIARLQAESYGSTESARYAAPGAGSAAEAAAAAMSAAGRAAYVAELLRRRGGGEAAPEPGSMPGLESVPARAPVHIIGVYEGSADRQPTPASLAAQVPGVRGGTPSMPSPREVRMGATAHTPREVRVVVRPGSTPIVLALASYEPVIWNVTAPGNGVAAVLLSGYHASTVRGLPDVRTLRIGSVHAYQGQGADYENLRRAISAYTGTRPVRSFQGTYSGSEFVVSGRD